MYLDGKKFVIHSTPDISTWLTQPDVNTIITSYLTIANLVAGIWQTQTVWRCVYILLEKTGLTLSEINFAAAMKIPTFGLKLFKAHAPQSLALWVGLLIFLMSWPAQLADPLASGGAISWMPDQAYSTQRTANNVSIAIAGADSHWSFYVSRFGSTRLAIVQNAAGMTLSKGSLVNDGSNVLDASFTPARRYEPLLRKHKVLTAVHNLTVPIMLIQNLSWISDETELSVGLQNAIRGDGYLNISSPSNPLKEALTLGTTALLKESPWSAPSISVLPKAIIATGSRYAAIYVQYIDTPSESCSAPAAIRTSKHCYAIAKFEIKAGVTNCDNSSQCRLANTSSSIVELTTKNLTIKADPLVNEVFAL